MNGELIAFALIGGLVLGAGIASVAVRRVFHSAIALGGALIAIAALYISMDAPILGVIQILVYVGGILTLLLFAVMFVAGDEADEEEVSNV